MSYEVNYYGKIAVSPSLTEADAAILTAFLSGDAAATPAIHEAIAAAPKREVPWCAGILSVSEDRSSLLPEEDDSRHGLVDWLELARDFFLAPKWYTLEGSVDFFGEEANDRGTIFVKNNVIEMIDTVSFQPGPSWDPAHYASGSVKNAIQELLDSTDDSGEADEFIMVAVPPLKTLRQLLSSV